jgi:hypothetical protein
MDAEQGYCAAECHWWTGDPVLGQQPRRFRKTPRKVCLKYWHRLVRWR